MGEIPPLLEPVPEAPRPPTMSLGARLLNVFAMPGAVFTEVATTRRSLANWLVPILFAAGVGVLMVLTVRCQPQVRESILRQQQKAIDLQLKAQKLNQANADLLNQWCKALSDRRTTMVLGIAGSLVVSVARVFWWGFVLSILGKVFLKVRFSFAKTIELAGLASMITVLGMLVLWLMVVKLRTGPSTAGVTFLISDVDSLGKNPFVLGAISIFSFWSIAVLSVALARLSGAPFLRAAWLIFAYWILQESCCGIFGWASLVVGGF